MNASTKMAPKADLKPTKTQMPAKSAAAPAPAAEATAAKTAAQAAPKVKDEVLKAATAVKTEALVTGPASKSAANSVPAASKSAAVAKPKTPAAKPKVSAGKAKIAATKPKAAAKPKSNPAPKIVTPVVEPAKAVPVVPNPAEASLQADVEAVSAFNKDNVEAVLAANAAFVDGMGNFNTLLFGLALETLERNVEAAKSVLECTSLEDLVSAQAAHAEAQYALALENSSKLTDASVKVAEQTSKPITERVSATVEKITASIAV